MNGILKSTATRLRQVGYRYVPRTVLYSAADDESEEIEPAASVLILIRAWYEEQQELEYDMILNEYKRLLS